MNSGYLIVFTTSPKKNAEEIAAHIITNRLAACANIISGVKSFFWWEGKIDSAEESLLIIKTRKKLFAKLKKAIKSKHPYDVPEIAAFPLALGNKEYLEWIDESCG